MSEYVSLLDLLKDKCIIIPSYQRDYAQGRNNKKSEEVRTLFVKSIVSAVSENKNSENKKLSLDYVYGYKKDNKLYLIDGQQRLTTLFLFYVYAASKSKEKTDYLKNFCYEEREGVAEYIQSKLGEKDREIEDLHSIPTAEAMERVYRLIEKEMNGNDISFEALENNIKLLVFSNENETSINEKTFWKMNARGKSLTEAEIFKSKACNYLKEKKGDGENFSRAFNDMYSKLFDEQKEDVIKAEKEMLKYIKSFFILRRVNDTTEINLDSYTPFDNYKDETLASSLNTLTNFFNKYRGEEIRNSLPLRMKEKVEDGLYGPIVSWFNNKKEVDGNFKRYLRIVANIIDNTSDSAERRKFIYDLSCCDNPYDEVFWKDKNGNSSKCEELQKQIKEEKEKIEAIKGGEVSEADIINAENFSFSFGSIPFLFPFDKFSERKKIYEEYFAPQSEKNNKLLDESKLKIAIKALVKSTPEQVKLCNVYFFDKSIRKDCGWRNTLRSGSFNDLLNNIKKEERGENIEKKDPFFDEFIKNQIISDDVLMESCFSDNSRLRWICNGYPALYPKGSYTYYAIILDNIHGGFVCKKLLNSVIEELKLNKGDLLFDAMNLDLKGKEGYDRETQLALYKGFYLYFRYKDKNFAFVIPWHKDDAYFDPKYLDRPFLVEITKKIENDQPENWYKTTEYKVVCDDVSVKNAKSDNNDDNNDSGKEASFLNKLIEDKAKGVADIIRNYCEKV